MRNNPNPELQKRITECARAKNADQRAQYLESLKVTPDQWERLRSRLQCAYDRCTNSNNQQYKNYGGRGIRFEFQSASDAAEQLAKKLGPIPDGFTLDRIDNDGPYSIDNIRYADMKTQANNKGQYQRTPLGERIRRIQEHRPDYHRESIRYLIDKGLSDEQIITKEKHRHVTTHLRHS
jgi:hypothetical protein